MPLVVIFMGVCGCGKSTVGSLVAQAMGYKFYEGDDYHPLSNLEKMQKGEALTDADRLPWLTELRSIIKGHVARGEPAILSCSALKPQYRSILLGGSDSIPGIINNNDAVVFVLLEPAEVVLRARLAERHTAGSHFMPPQLLDSQLKTLEYKREELFMYFGPEEFETGAGPAALAERVVGKLRQR